MGADLSRQSAACSKPLVLVEEVTAPDAESGASEHGKKYWETPPGGEPHRGCAGDGGEVTEQQQKPLTALADEALPESPCQAAPETVIIFDWDDTLLCSTSLNSSQVQLRQLEELQRAAEAALHAAMSLGEVLIVTNGNGTWVHDSASRFMPRLLPLLSKLKVVSARHLFEQLHPGDPFMWKRVAFTRLLMEERSYAAGLNLVALGDQLPEIDAASHVVKLLGGSSMVKTVKFKEAPTVTEIIGQLGRVEQDLPKIVKASSSHAYSLTRRPLPLQWDNLSAYANGWRCTSEDDHPWNFSDLSTFKDFWQQVF